MDIHAKTIGFINNVCPHYSKYNYIDPAAYENANLKRGLRNADGTGVLAGITRIGSVQGYDYRDGERIPAPGSLYYRGISVEKLIDGFAAEDRFGFEEVCYLLLFGKLPTATELADFMDIMEQARNLPPNFTEDMILKAPSHDIMNKLARSILVLYSSDPDPDGLSLPNILRHSLELIARVPVIVAHAYAAKRHYFHDESLHIHWPRPGLSLAENFLHSLRPDNQFTREEARLLDICMVLHAEHGGGNNSAFACRVLTSSHTDTFSAVSAAVGSLKGPRHGGANQKVMHMFADIRQNLKDETDDDEVEAYLEKLIHREAGDKSGLIYGMGHAVYTLSDPRAVVLKQHAKKLAAQRGLLDEFALMEKVEALTPKVFARVKGDGKIISANVDMYSGLVYKMLGIPEELYTPIFAVARMAGWCAHRVEEIYSNGRIVRPAYRSVVQQADYIPMNQRTGEA